MRTKYQVILFLCCIVLNYTFSYSNNVFYAPASINYITVANGLPQNTVQSIEKDHFGFMWFGTDNGLCRFDGYDFDYYNSKKNEEGLWDDRIVDVISDGSLFLWIITPNGLQLFNTLTSKFEKVKDNALKELFAENISHIKPMGRTVWVATQNKGVYKLNVGEKAEQFSIAKQYFMDGSLPEVSFIEKDKDNVVYLGTSEGVYVNNPLTDKFDKLKGLGVDISGVDVQTLFDDGEDLWIGTPNGLYRYSKRNSATVQYIHDPSVETTIPHWNITCIGTNGFGDILVGTLGGLCSYNPQKDSFTYINLFPSSKNSNRDVFIRSLYADSLGNVWVGTEKTGLVHLYNYHKQFNALPNEARFKPFNENIVNSIYRSKDVLWVGTAGDGLLQYNFLKDKIKHFKTGGGIPGSIQSDFITCVFEDNDGQIWVGTWGMGIQKLSSADKNSFTTYNINQGLSNDFVSCIYACSNNLMVVGTQGGLSVYDKRNDMFIPVPVKHDVHGKVWQVGCIQEDRDGYLWIGTTNGLYRFKASLIYPQNDQQLVRYDIVTFKESNEAGSLPDNYITCLDMDKQGHVWIGTYGKGVAKCVPGQDGSFRFDAFQERDGLANNVVYELLTDKNNNIWISTENGLSKFNPEDETFVSYYHRDGLKNDQYYWSAACKAEDGYLYFGGLNGLNFFHPDSIKSYPYKPNTYITKLKVYNSDVMPGEELHGKVAIKNSAFYSDSIHLSYKDNVFSFEFSALPYYLSSKIKYAYKLNGVDKDWVFVDADRRVASYTNLDGGEYLFQVRSTDLDGAWMDNITSALVIIKPPMWKTSWFKFVLVILIFLIGSGYIRYRSIRISQQKKRLEKLVKERTQEIKEKNELLEINARELQVNNTQLAHRQEEIEKQKEQLEQQNTEIISQRDQLITLNKEIESIHQKRMEFFTNISHEFRTPLTLIISPIEKMLSETFAFSKENVQKTVSYVKRNAERLLLLTNEITTFRKFEAGKMKVVLTNGNVGDFISEIAESFRELAENKSIRYSVSVDYNLEDTWYDQAKLENILFNLISNAIKYTNEEGKVSISVTKIKNEAEQPHLLLNIQDNGIGIKKEYQDKVFERFYRDISGGGNKGYGTGIGLALAKQMVEVLNGSISLDSEENKGSSFKVILPIEKQDFPEHEVQSGISYGQVQLKERIDLLVTNEDNKHASTGDGEIDSIGESKTKILVVDDNVDLREFLAESLSDTYAVTTAKDGEEGYGKALEKDYDLVVSDVMMPKVDGLELCKRLKNNIHTSHLPIILLTAKGQEEDFVEGLELGADDYVSKPFNLGILQARINSLIENRKKLRKFYHKAETAVGEIPADIPTTSLDEEFMGKINQVIESNYTDPAFDIEAFSSKMYVSRSLLYKKLKALTDVSPIEYINIYRLKKSTQLLKSKQYQISEVAFMVGFNDPKYFSRVFKKFFNCSPSAYLE